MKKDKFVIILKWGALLGAGLSVIKLLGFFAEKMQYPFGPVNDLLMVVAIVACLFMAIREVRDKQQDGIIKFSKAFLLGCGIVFVGYFILCLYMMLHFTAIDKNGVANINAHNIQHTTAAIQKDTITTEELADYYADLKRIALNVSHAKAENDSVRMHADSGIIAMVNLHKMGMERLTKHDSSILKLDTFNISANNQLRATTTYIHMNQPAISELSYEAVEIARDSMSENPVWKQRLNSIRNQIPQYHTTFAAATITPMSILLYGLMLNIFVALFLYRKEKNVCSMPENEQQESDNPTETSDKE